MGVCRPFSLLSLLSLLLLALPGEQASATLAEACAQHSQMKADDEPCPKEPPFFLTKEQSCVDECQKATDLAVMAKISCDQHAQTDQQLIEKGAQQSQSAADASQQRQDSHETSNGANMSSGQQVQTERRQNAESMLPLFTMCIMQAMKCNDEGGGGSEVATSCAKAKGATENEIANLDSAADQMQQNADTSNDNASNLGKNEAPGAVQAGTTQTTTSAATQIGSTGGTGATIGKIDEVGASTITIDPSDAAFPTIKPGSASGAAAGAGASGATGPAAGASGAGAGALGEGSGGGGAGSLSSGGGGSLDGQGAADGSGGKVATGYGNGIEVGQAGGLKAAGGTNMDALFGSSLGTGKNAADLKVSTGKGAQAGAGRLPAGVSGLGSRDGKRDTSIFEIVRARYGKLQALGEI